MSGIPTGRTLLLQVGLTSEGLEVLLSYLAHVLNLFALRSGIVDLVCFICEHDSPYGVATKAESCATEDYDGYGGTGRQCHGRITTTMWSIG